jgi:hypothetical protein
MKLQISIILVVGIFLSSWATGDLQRRTQLHGDNYGYENLTSCVIFAVCVQLRLKFTPLLFVISVHCMLRPNWPSSSLQDVLQESAVPLFLLYLPRGFMLLSCCWYALVRFMVLLVCRFVFGRVYTLQHDAAIWHYRCETWSLMLRKEHELGNDCELMLTGIFYPMRDDVIMT